MSLNHHIFTFTRRFSMAHRLIADCNTKCATPHGHNENVVVRCIPRGEFRHTSGANMSQSFDRAKSHWHSFIDGAVDHAFQLSDRDPLLAYFMREEPNKLPRIMVTPGDPTTEMLCMVLARKFNAIAGTYLDLLDISIEETPTNTVTLPFRDISHTDDYVSRFIRAEPDESVWYDRSDLTINDFPNLG